MSRFIVDHTNSTLMPAGKSVLKAQTSGGGKLKLALFFQIVLKKLAACEAIGNLEILLQSWRVKLCGLGG
ncbi:hypothetical protein [Microbulbifer aggregans]|uniref:hypothetical protein n=1 Tax=Microbulbifer aggregans TaxID=1769779 RepID=UPI0011AB5043|nr:hypothetical protein [Microbulbifer aggregans]